MWTIIAILLTSAAIAMLELPSLKKKRLYKEFVIVCCLILLGTILSIAQSMHMNLPNPLDLITFVFQPFSKLILGFLQ
jgi:predicted neutral ceramidase superfamily lipid hydrolase